MIPFVYIFLLLHFFEMSSHPVVGPSIFVNIRTISFLCSSNVICDQGFLPNKSCVLSIYYGQCLCALLFNDVYSEFVSSCEEIPILVCHFILVQFSGCFLFTWCNLWALCWGWKGWFLAARLSPGFIQLTTGTDECCLHLQYAQCGQELL